MEIKEAVEQIKKIARVENGEISIGQGLERKINELTHYIIVAILNGYTLCKVDEAVEQIKVSENNVVREWIKPEKAIEIIKEACK